SFSLGLTLYTVCISIGRQEITRFLPLFALIMDGFVAYGIATRRILAVSVILQRVVAYALMAVYLTAVYVASEWVFTAAFNYLVPDTTYLSHLLSALVVAFSVTPAHGWMQAVSHRLFASADLLNINVVLERAGQMFQEVSTEANLMEKFSKLIEESFGTTKVILLRPEKNGAYRQAYPEVADKKEIFFQSDSPVIQLLNQEHEAFTVETLHRMRPTPQVTGALAELEKNGAALVIGSFMRKEMKAILLLTAKKSGRIYDLREQRALQMLCDQFAVALENSNLYTTIQNGKIYNEILLDSLTSGIVAVDEDRKIIIFNQRAQKLTGLPESAVVNKPMTVLPPVLIEGLETVLNSGAGFRDKDRTIRRGEQELPIRVSGSMFRGYTGNLLGALLIFNDMTIIKKMEEQIRRTDRLSSLGTLSAGMAHEIKNPLVTIKTFTQLLPHQYNNAEFRQTFFDLVGQEVTRIDTIVNRLLNFARPAPASLQPVSLHKVVDNSLRLIERQLVQNGIVLKRHLDAKYDMVEADAEQLNQTFINFFLNAIYAMTDGGTLTVRTSLANPLTGTPQAGGRDGVRGKYIQLDIQDVGCGIAQDRLNKIFDPFFTTREGGVGLGLSVSHGIIQEHSGVVDVESKEGRGTVFHVLLPLIRSRQQQENKA
ncbi:MAG: two-component system, NtrC family, sensor histidine kinase AtoS, partial [Verrucomicrobiota bacterium]|nr:two-component system, NtrC family, sensor histidine kinase AtoS [Verrucomicrobiota bacterium]